MTLGNDARGNLIRIDNALRELPQQLTTSKNQLENLQSQMEFTKAELGKPFPQEAELAQKSQRLAELNALLDMDGKQTTERDESKTNQKNLCRWTGRYDGPVPAFLRLCRSAG